MITRRRLATLVAFTVAGLGGFVASEALAPGDVRVPAAVDRVHRFHAIGPSAEYSGDAGSIGGVPALVFEVTGPAARTAVVEASFQYRTKGQGPFVVVLGVREVDHGPRADVRPDELVLSPAPDGGATTVRFLVPELEGGLTYEAAIGVNSSFTQHGTNRVATRKLLITVELAEN